MELGDPRNSQPDVTGVSPAERRPLPVERKQLGGGGPPHLQIGAHGDSHASQRRRRAGLSAGSGIAARAPYPSIPARSTAKPAGRFPSVASPIEDPRRWDITSSLMNRERPV